MHRFFQLTVGDAECRDEHGTDKDRNYRKHTVELNYVNPRFLFSGFSSRAISVASEVQGFETRGPDPRAALNTRDLRHKEKESFDFFQGLMRQIEAGENAITTIGYRLLLVGGNIRTSTGAFSFLPLQHPQGFLIFGGFDSRSSRETLTSRQQVPRCRCPPAASERANVPASQQATQPNSRRTAPSDLRASLSFTRRFRTTDTATRRAGSNVKCANSAAGSKSGKNPHLARERASEPSRVSNWH